MPWTRAIPSLSIQLDPIIHCHHCECCCSIPDGEDTAGLGEAGLLLDTANALLEDGGDLGGGSLSVGGIAASEGVDNGGGGARL